LEAPSSVDEILDFAIGQEEAATRFYTDLAEQTEQVGMRSLFEDFAAQEMGHKAKLLAFKEGRIPVPAPKKVMDLKIGDYLLDVKPGPDLDFQGALVVAMKREKAAFKMYDDFAAMVEDDALRGTFLALAQEEAKHKLYLEIQYDEHVLTEN
jgi:rubrerythrin